MNECDRLRMMRADEMSVDSRVVSREAKAKEARTTENGMCGGQSSDRACVHAVPQCRTRRKKPRMRGEKKSKRKKERKDETEIEL
jgi:hypothetical protein